jgi:hypothetical protein
VQIEALTNASDVTISISEDASVLAFGLPSIGMAAVYEWNTDDAIDWVLRGETFRSALEDDVFGVVDVALSADESILVIASSGSNVSFLPLDAAETWEVDGTIYDDTLYKFSPSYASMYSWTSQPSRSLDSHEGYFIQIRPILLLCS